MKTFNITYKFNEEYFNQLKAYYALPIWKRLFRKLPEAKD